MTDLTHLDALQQRLRNENDYIANSTNAHEIQLRRVWILQIEKEIAEEYAHLGINPVVVCDLSNDELLKELTCL